MLYHGDALRLRGGGCSGSKELYSEADPAHIHLQGRGQGSELFAKTYPMYVMPWTTFEAQGLIPRSDRAHQEGLVVEYDPAQHVAIFISHRWWGGNVGPNATTHDSGRPDLNSNLKFEVICQGVRNLLKHRPRGLRLKPAHLVLWMDWFSIDQDDMEKKLRGVRSLIHYVTCCDVMLIPVFEPTTDPDPQSSGPFSRVSMNVYKIPAYGERGWCRCEFFIFVCSSEIQGVSEYRVPLFACGTEDGGHVGAGTWKHYNMVTFHGGGEYGGGDLPHQGELTVASDREQIVQLEEDMVRVYGNEMVKKELSKQASIVQLQGKMLRGEHMKQFASASASLGNIKELYLNTNQLGDGGGMRAFAGVMASLVNLTHLELDRNRIGDDGMVDFAGAMTFLVKLKVLHLSRNRIGDEGMIALSGALASLTNLQELFLDNNDRIGDGGMQAFASAVASGYLANLKVLNMNENKIGDEGMKAFAGAMGSLGKLKTLDIRFNQIGDDGMVAFTGGMASLKALKALDLAGNPAGDPKGTTPTPIQAACAARRIKCDAFLQSD